MSEFSCSSFLIVNIFWFSMIVKWISLGGGPLGQDIQVTSWAWLKWFLGSAHNNRDALELLWLIDSVSS